MQAKRKTLIRSDAAVRSVALKSAIIVSILLLAGCLIVVSGEALAQARHPFNVGVSEGGGIPGSGLARWILTQQIAFERMMAGTVQAITTDRAALWTLIGIAFAYGVFHAAGPGHGKAVVASYMLANERALKRGLIISLLAAILQGVVAIGIVGVLAILLNATAARMKAAASFVEVASYLAVAVLGLWLVWRKGGA
ncbi:MAG: high frequency lysogenization protein HflD, partial [Hyphomicrobiales bacterium]|nr:high frequency lysogenization protein HflD [Hyphomicrobiales bacterium]